MGVWRRSVFRYAVPGVQLRPSQIFAFFLVLALGSIRLRYGFGIWRIEKIMCLFARLPYLSAWPATDAGRDGSGVIGGVGVGGLGGNHGGIFNAAVCAGADGSGNPDGKDSACSEIAER